MNSLFSLTPKQLLSQLGCLILLLLSFATTAQTSWLFQNAAVIVGDGEQLDSADVLVVDGQIVAIGASLEQAAAANSATVIDLSGKWLMPTLIDGHAHLGYQSRSSWGADNYGLANLEDNLRQYAYYGFGAVFSAGSDPVGLGQELQQSIAVQQDLPEFLFAAGMAPPGQGPNNQFLVHTSQVEAETGMTILRGLENPEQARRAVAEAAQKGVKFIKIWVDDRGGSQLKLSPAIYRAVIEQARSLDLKVFVHQQTARDMPDLIDAGVHGFLHGRIGAEFTSALAQQGKGADVFVIPNLGLGELRREAIGDDPFLRSFLSVELREQLGVSANRSAVPERDERVETELRAGFERIEEANLDLVLGTDAGAVPGHPFGYTGHRELEIFVSLEMTPMTALVTATGNAAKHLKLDDLGLVAVGKRASLLVLNANPLTDIRNTRAIHAVYLNGRLIDRDAIAASLPN